MSEREQKTGVPMVVLDEKVVDKWMFLNTNKKMDWIALEYDEKDVNKLTLGGAGKGGILGAIDYLKPVKVCFAVIRGLFLFGSGKIQADIILQWIPNTSSLFDRSRIIFHVEHVIRHFKLTNYFVIEAKTQKQLDFDLIERQIRKILNQTDGKFEFNGNPGTQSPLAEEEKKSEPAPSVTTDPSQAEPEKPVPEQENQSVPLPETQEIPTPIKPEEEEKKDVDVDKEGMKKKLIELSEKYKLKNVLPVDDKYELKKVYECEVGMDKQKKKCEIYLTTGHLLICGLQKNKCIVLRLGIHDFRCYEDEQDKKIFIIETNETSGKKNKNKAQVYIIGLGEGTTRDEFLFRIVETMIPAKCQTFYIADGNLRSKMLFQSFLQKEGGGRFSYALKKRWHVLGADLVMKYYDSPDTTGKLKGSYPIRPGITIFGRGRDIAKVQDIDTKKNKKSGLFRLIQNTRSIDIKAVSGLEKKECWMYIDSPQRTYFMMADDVVQLDNWMNVLAMVGAVKKDVLDWEMQQWMDDELEKLKDRVNNLYCDGLNIPDDDLEDEENEGEDDDFDLPDMFGGAVAKPPQVVKQEEKQEKEEKEEEGEGEFSKIALE